MNYRLIATEVGDLVKWDTSVNTIKRAAGALFRFPIEHFPNDAITSARAQEVYDSVMSLAKQRMAPAERNQLLVAFCRRITPEQHKEALARLLHEELGPSDGAIKEAHQEFIGRGMHARIIEHCKKLYAQGNYFHAVFEACKVYNKDVQRKAQSALDGKNLMLQVWAPENGVLKVTPCQTETDRNVQDGVKFLSAGLMAAMRNPAAHEPALDWPIEKQDCLDMLSFVSFLLRQLDKATYFSAEEPNKGVERTA